MRRNIITILLSFAAAFGIFLWQPSPPFGAIVSPNTLFDGKNILFSYTDDNANENLIIRSDSGRYSDDSQVYFSIENTTSIDQNVGVVFTLKNDKTKVTEVHEFVSNVEVIISSASQPIKKKTISSWDKKNTTKLIKNKTSVLKKGTVGDNYSSFQSIIPAGQTKTFKTNIDVPYGELSDLAPNPDSNKISIVSYEQEFFIEVFGDQGGYGHLDPIAFDNSVGQEFAAATSYTVSGFTVTGSNTYAIVGIGLRTNTGDITGVTFNGATMTELQQYNNNPGTMTIWLFGLAGPTTGNVVITGDTSLAAEVVVSTYTGVAQTGSTGTVATATGTAPTVTVDVTSATGEMVVDIVGWRTGGDGTAGAGQTKRSEGVAGNGISMDLATSDEAGAATTTMSWTIDGTTADGWLTIGVPLKPVATATIKKQDIIFFD